MLSIFRFDVRLQLINYKVKNIKKILNIDKINKTKLMNVIIFISKHNYKLISLSS